MTKKERIKGYPNSVVTYITSYQCNLYFFLVFINEDSFCVKYNNLRNFNIIVFVSFLTAYYVKINYN